MGERKRERRQWGRKRGNAATKGEARPQMGARESVSVEKREGGREEGMEGGTK